MGAMRTLVTGSSGHLGEALVRTLRAAGHATLGIDARPGPCTSRVGSIVDRAFVREAVAGARTILHAATLHKPHLATHSRQDFIDTNLTGTLHLLEEATAAGVQAFVFTSTTSVFGDALIPPPGAPAAWIDEAVAPVPKNIYGVTKAAAEDLCQLFHRNAGLACVVLRTSRFFPEADDNATARAAYADANLKVNEFLHRRIDLEDVVSAHLRAAACAPRIGFGRYLVSATTPLLPGDLAEVRAHAPLVIGRRLPEATALYARLRWELPPGIDRVYVNHRAQQELGWRPRHDFRSVLERAARGDSPLSPLARAIGAKGYNAEPCATGTYPLQSPPGAGPPARP